MPPTLSLLARERKSSKNMAIGSHHYALCLSAAGQCAWRRFYRQRTRGKLKMPSGMLKRRVLVLIDIARPVL